MEEPKTSEEPTVQPVKTEFKMPVLVGKIGKYPRKALNTEQKTEVSEKNASKPKERSEKQDPKSNLPPSMLLKEMSTPIPYKEPKWSGLCPDGSDYALEVIKSGMIVERIDLTTKTYFVFGRLANSDVLMAHPTISRHHAVLQYKAFADEGEPSSGWYLYDLGSTHGTFLNKDRLKNSHYSRVRVGHQIKFGSSSRTYILLGPDFDAEGESELTVTEIKQKTLQLKLDRDRIIKESIEQREIDRLAEEKKKEERGIDWGMGEDAEEETDLSENPFAVTSNEELYLQDPKKTLRGYFEREGHELNYDCEERGVGQYICRVELPMDDARGRPVVAEVIHSGKKKEAVVQCALEACRLLDRAGLLRQAKHESRQKKKRDWSADDFYDSDDDNYLDRTGAVERKRKERMRKHGGEVEEKGALTYDDLLKQITAIEAKIAVEEKSLARLRQASKPKTEIPDDGDSLDSFMSSLQHAPSMAQKADISNTKMVIQKLKAELAKTQRLAEIARPAHLPPLVKKGENKDGGSKMAVKVGSNSVVYGKRIRLKEDLEKKPKIKEAKQQEDSQFVEEVDSDEDEHTDKKSNAGDKSNSEEKSNTGNNSNAGDNSNTVDKSNIEDISNAVDNSNAGDNSNAAGKKKATEKEKIKSKDVEKEEKTKVTKKVYGPMRPPENYVAPENYFDQETDRDLPEIMEDD